MIDLDALPTPITSSRDFERERRRRNLIFLLMAFGLSAVAGGSFILFGWDSLLGPLILLVLLSMVALMWLKPISTLYIIFGSTCLFEIFATHFPDALTDRVPFWWNLNTIFEVYVKSNPKALPVNAFEVIIAIAAMMSILRNVYFRTVSIKGGPLLLPLCLYMGCVFFAWVNGLSSGGDFKISLQEVRAQFYFLIAYLMAFNMVKQEKQVTTLLWISAITIAIKGILYTFRRYVTLAGVPISDQGVGSHEEAFFFDTFVVQAIVLWLCELHPRMRRWMFLTLPLVMLGNVATNRRAGTAAMAVALPFLLLATYRGLAKRRRAAVALGAFLAVTLPVYYQIFKNSENPIAQPARAIKSYFAPDERDFYSNLYRMAENGCQMDTIQQSPQVTIFGYGYGKRMLHSRQIADISQGYDWWDVLPHNQILWVWMRTGTIGFFMFWLMVSAGVILCARVIRASTASNAVKGANMLAMTILGMLMIFGLLDIQLSNFRDMLYAGVWMGAALSLGKDHIS